MDEGRTRGKGWVPRIVWGPHGRECDIPNAGPPLPKDPRPCRSTPAREATDNRRLQVDRDKIPTCENPAENSQKETCPCHHEPAWLNYRELGKPHAYDCQKDLAASIPKVRNSDKKRTEKTSDVRKTSTSSIEKQERKSMNPLLADSKPFLKVADQKEKFKPVATKSSHF